VKTSFSRVALPVCRFPSSVEICIARCTLLALRELRFSSPLRSFSFFVLEFFCGGESSFVDSLHDLILWRIPTLIFVFNFDFSFLTQFRWLIAFQ
jgi:hypothetical protein